MDSQHNEFEPLQRDSTEIVVTDITAQLNIEEYSFSSDGVANKMDTKEESYIRLLIGEAVLRAQDRREAHGGDIEELERLLETAPNSMETVEAIDLLYRGRFWWEKLLDRW